MDTNEVEFRTAEIRPIDFLMQAKEMIGDKYLLFLGITFVGLFVGSLFWIILGGPMLCGIYLCLLKRMRGEEVAFENLFKGFDYFVESLLATLIMFAAALVVTIPLTCLIFAGMAIGAATGEEEGMVAGVLISYVLYFLGVILLSVVMGTLFGFTYPLIVDRGLKAVPALRTSIQAARANLSGLLVFYLTIMAISFVCALCCYFPAFLVAPLTIGATALVYREVFPEGPAAASDLPQGA